MVCVLNSSMTLDYWVFGGFPISMFGLGVSASFETASGFQSPAVRYKTLCTVGPIKLLSPSLDGLTLAMFFFLQSSSGRLLFGHGSENSFGQFGRDAAARGFCSPRGSDDYNFREIPIDFCWWPQA